MCGIVGVNAKNNKDYSELIREMLSNIKHRGPEHGDIYQKNTVWLGHRRLKIIDVSDSANQPMQSACGRYVIIYNGEIYNYREIKQKLIGLGHAFQTTSDTEVILQAYQRWGSACVDDFNGIWAFCIYDLEKNTLFLSRDRFGVKPLYYVHTESCFAFASEIKALLPLFNGIYANKKRLAEFLIYGKSEDNQTTFYQDVHKVPAGHNITYDCRDKTLATLQYYDIKKTKNTLSQSEVIDKVAALLQSSINYQLISDVPIAVSLSGGLDSSVITKMVSNHMPSAFTAFTAISEDGQNSESQYAQTVADDTKTPWVQTKPSYEDFVAELDNIVYAQEEPFSTASIIMQYFLMKKVHENNFKVLLDGQGADEIFLGYERYIILEIMRSLSVSQAIHLYKNVKQYMTNNSNLSFKKLVYYSFGSVFPRLRQLYMRSRTGYFQHDVLLKPEYIYDYAMQSKKSCFDLQKLEITETNLPALLRFADKNSMFFSVEDRVPFLDHRLVEFCLSLPVEMKIHHGWSKWLLRTLFDKQLPDGIVWRKNKIAYEAPEKIWLAKHHDIMKSQILDSKMLSMYCDMTKLAKQFKNLDDRQIWRLYSAALWEDKFLIHG